MIYEKYGKTFKQLRIQKNLKLCAFESQGISSSALCKFERGNSMLKFDKLIPALEKLSVSLHEYEKFLNHWQDSKSDFLLQNVKVAIINNNLEKLSIFHQEALEIDELFFALSIKTKYSTLNDSELEQLIDYFEEIKLWRKIDLYTLYLSLDSLKLSHLPFIIEGFYLTNNQIFNSYEENNLLAEIICHSTIIFISKGHKEIAEHLLKYFQIHADKHSMHVKNFYLFVHGYWISEFKQKELGSNYMKQALKILEVLDYHSLATYYKSLYNRYSNLKLD